MHVSMLTYTLMMIERIQHIPVDLSLKTSREPVLRCVETWIDARTPVCTCVSMYDVCVCVFVGHTHFYFIKPLRL
jgi:hypothetical protein